MQGKLSLAVLLLIMGTVWLTTEAQETGLSGRRPNIILVMTDDQGKGDFSCFGNPDLKTPNLDQLYSMSTRFADFQVSPTCSPTRAAIMTGRHEFRNGVTHTLQERERLTLDATTIAESLADAGYATGIFGKWHLGDEDSRQPRNRGFQESLIHGAGGIGQDYQCSCADAPPNQVNRYFDCVLNHNGQFVQTAGFCTDVFFSAALGWIDRQREQGQPFFACVVPNAPHGPMIAPDEYKQPFLDAGFGYAMAGRYGMIVNIDDNMGRLIKMLNEWELQENTLLIFMTDNGQAAMKGNRNGKPMRVFSAGFRTGKNTVYAGGTTVPAFWYWQGKLPEGQDINALAAHIDLFPTLADIAGAKLPESGQLEGRSLVPLLENRSAAWPDRYLFVHLGRWDKGTDPDTAKYQNFAVRNSNYRLVNNRELYDVVNDPYESTNVISAHPDIVNGMMAAYDQWWDDTRPLMVNEDVPNSAVQPYRVNYEKQLKNGGIDAWQPPDLR